MNHLAGNPVPSPPSSSAVSILDRVLSEHTHTWTGEEAEGIMRLMIDERMSPDPGNAAHPMSEQFGVFLELVKCRARMRLRANRGE